MIIIMLIRDILCKLSPTKEPIIEQRRVIHFLIQTGILFASTSITRGYPSCMQECHVCYHCKGIKLPDVVITCAARRCFLEFTATSLIAHRRRSDAICAALHTFVLLHTVIYCIIKSIANLFLLKYVVT